nr:NADH dehydrogenase subunit 4L [Eumenotes sp. HEM140]
MPLYYVFMIFMSCSLVVFCSTHKHLLLSLLSLEFMMLCVYYVMFMLLMNYNYELYFSLMFLVFSVCEGALGLSVLVNLVRFKGNDYLSSISSLSW